MPPFLYNQPDTVRGDVGSLPNAGSGTGVTDTYDADLGPDATNRIKGITRQTGSDMLDEEAGAPNI